MIKPALTVCLLGVLLSTAARDCARHSIESKRAKVADLGLVAEEPIEPEFTEPRPEMDPNGSDWQAYQQKLQDYEKRRADFRKGSDYKKYETDKKKWEEDRRKNEPARKEAQRDLKAKRELAGSNAVIYYLITLVCGFGALGCLGALSMKGTDMERAAAILGAVILAVFLFQYGFIDFSRIG